MWRQILVIVAIAGSALGQSRASQPPASCPVTDASAQPFVAPASSMHGRSWDRFFFGTEKLWTELPLSGVYATVKDGNEYSTKQAWFSSSYNWRTLDEWRSRVASAPKLTITERRLDVADKSAGVPPQIGNPSFEENGGSFFMSGPHFPALGCWEVTGQIEDTRLTFVLWVVD